MSQIRSACARAAVVISLQLVLWGAMVAAAQTTVAGTIPGQFSVSESGAATYRIPIQVPPGVAGMAPKLELGYNSQSGNGLLGMGWSLSGLSAITRCPRTMAQDGVRGGVNFDMNDRYCMDGQRLIPVSGTYGAAGSEYRTELDGFSKVMAYGSAGNGPSFFIVKTKSGLTIEYGNTEDSHIEAQGKPTVRVWAKNKVSDSKGNYYTVTYVKDSVNGDYRPNRIDYTGNSSAGLAPNYSVQFSYYEPRPDIDLSYLAGSSVKNPMRMTNIKTLNGSSVVRDYRVSYEQGTATQRSRLKTITECDGAGGCLPSTTLTMSDSAPATFTNKGSLTPYPEWTTPIIADFNGDGLADVLINTNTPGVGWSVYLSNGDGTFRLTGSLTPYSGWTTPIIADFNGDGLADVLINTNTSGAGWYTYLSNGNGTFSHTGSLTPYFQWTTPIIADFNGDGKSDVLINTNTAGAGWYTYLSNGNGTFSQSSTLTPYPEWKTPVIADFNGDGLADVLINTNTPGAGWYTYLSNGLGSFSQTGALTPYPEWKTPVIADFNGDGKADVLINTTTSGVGWSTYLSNGNGTFSLTGSLTPYPEWTTPVIADFNGDGLADVLINTTTPGVGWSTYLSKGNGTFGLTGSLTPYPEWTTPTIADFNGDGKSDVLINTNTPGVGWSTYLSNGNGTFGLTGSLTPYHQWTTPIIADFNGDGRPDVLINTTTANVGWSTYVSPYGLPDFLTWMHSGLGNTTTIARKFLTDNGVYTKDTGANASVYPKVDLQIPLYVVSEVQQSNGIGGMLTSQFSYGGLKAEQGTGRGMLGFRWMKSKNLGNNLESYTEFNQNWPLTGSVAKSETRLADSTGSVILLKRSANTFAVTTGSLTTGPAGANTFVYLNHSVEESWDLNGTPYPAVTSVYEYGQSPQYGDPTKITVTNSQDSSKITENEYQSADLANWILGRLKKAKVTSAKP